MLNFFEMAKNDLCIFFNDFATNHILNNVQISLIIDDEQSKQYNLKSVSGLFDNDTVVFVRTEDLKDFNIRIDTILILDNAQKVVTNISESDGITEIALKQIKGYGYE